MNKTSRNRLTYNFGSLLSIFLISVAIIGLQLFLMRSLSVTRYYHFSYLVISTALLGFGASGTFLSFFYDWMKRRSKSVLHVLFLLLHLSVPASFLVGQQLPIDIEYILFDTSQQLYMLIYNLLMFLPFFFGATLIGFFVTYYKRNISTVYGANLLGSGVGGITALLIMFWIPPEQLPLQIVVFVFLSYVSWIISQDVFSECLGTPVKCASVVFCIIVTIFSVLLEPTPHIDPHKSMANLERLENQGDARHVLRQFGPRAQLDVYDSPAIHYTLFAGLQSRSAPPPQYTLLSDGSMAGTIFTIDSTSEAEILDETPQSLPYRLVGDSARVLLLGVTGGTNIWLAKRFGSQHITAVQTNPQLVSMMKKELKSKNGNIFNRSDLTITTQSPRHYLEQTDKKFDVIQLVRAESMSGGSSGLQSLSENYLLTSEAIREAYQHLSPDGFLSITRGIETPPRDNIKIFATFANSLKQIPGIDPSRHLLQSRNYLAVNTLLSRSPISDETLQSYRAHTDSLLMDNDFHPGFEPSGQEPYNKIGGPENSPLSWYSYAAQQILQGNAETFYNNWVYRVRPTTDNQPYFSNFFKWSSLDQFKKTYGRYWLQKIELGYVVLVITLAEILVIAFLLIILPLLFRRTKIQSSGSLLKTLVFFTATGIGFIFLEMVFIQKFTRFMGDPIYSTGAALTSMLVFAGLGSIAQEHLSMSPHKKVLTGGIVLLIITVTYIFLLESIFNAAGDQSTAIRFILTCLLIFPPAFSLGWFFPIGVSLLEHNAPGLIPWAWGIDGFTSVAGAPLAVLLSMSFGFNFVLLIGLGFYGLLISTMPFWSK